jgi:uncharacterized membrane protein YdbT with pleckstrin-like domain
MWSSWTALVLRLLRVPSEPHAPAGAGRVQTFRAAPNFWKFIFVKWGIAQVAALGGLVFSIYLLRSVFTGLPPRVVRVIEFFELLGFAAFIAQLPFTLAMLRLDYEMRWYLVSDRSLRIREGLLTVREKTMTFANIQNVGIRQGPLQKILGIADLEVRSAGGGAPSAGKKGEGQSQHEDLHVGYFRGVDNAAEIRDILREGVRLHRDTGLGDPDEPEPVVADDAIAAAREVLAEAKALRKAMGGSR